MQFGRIVILIVLCAPVPAWAQAAAGVGWPAGGCVVVAANSTVSTPPQLSQRREPSRKPARIEIPAPHAREIRELGVVLRGLSNPKTSAVTLAGLKRGEPFTVARLAVLMDDARSLLAELHARELQKDLGGMGGLGSDARALLEGQLQIMERCGKPRFDHRGGIAEYERVRLLVQEYRRDLEPFIFERSPFGSVPGSTAPVDKRQAGG